MIKLEIFEVKVMHDALLKSRNYIFGSYAVSLLTKFVGADIQKLN